MICIEFPPVNTTGNYRNAAFAKFLSARGVDVTVLTANENDLEQEFKKGIDLRLLKGLEAINIMRFRIQERHKYLRTKIGNKLRLWFGTTDDINDRWFTKEAKKVINAQIIKHKPDFIFASLPPFSIYKSAIYLSKTHNIPLITDMRDAWSLWCTSPFSTRFHHSIVRNKEHQLFNHSAYILGVTPELVEDFKSVHPSISDKKFQVIYNGYDHIEPSINSKIKSLPDTSPIKIGYIGSFYYSPEDEKNKSLKWYERKGLSKLHYWPRNESWIYRSPYFFLKTLNSLFIQQSTLKANIEFHHVGKTPEWLYKMTEELGLEGNLVVHGFKTKQEVLEIQNSWDYILATSEKVIGGKHFCLPSKLFDCIETQKPILGFLTEGTQKDMLLEYQQAEIFNPEDFEANSQRLFDIFTSKNNINTTPLNERFSRDHQALKLYTLLVKYRTHSHLNL